MRPQLDTTHWNRLVEWLNGAAIELQLAGAPREQIARAVISEGVASLVKEVGLFETLKFLKLMELGTTAIGEVEGHC